MERKYFTVGLRPVYYEEKNNESLLLQNPLNLPALQQPL